ncbi:hypothetical protein BDC45DRAFT_503159 [Circinella umbellata]|nr:hypothetical protein BDC45DRAFT_503159 [Circinella umbellata]
MSAQEPTTTTNTTEQPTVETTSAESKPVPPLPENSGEEAPSPSPSKSNNTPGRRLSVLIGKAKKSITTATEKLTTPDTTHSPTKTSDNTNKEATTTEEPSTTATSTTPAPVAEPEEPSVQNNKEEASDKSEKRKSLFFLDNIFNRSKSPTAKEEETKPADEPPVPEASGERSTEDVAPVPPPKDAPKDVHKDTVIDQLKRRATEVNHFFNKKRAEASAPTTETATATAETKPNDAAETTEQAQGSSTEKKPATQLGRRLTKLLNSFPANKKKADDTAPTEPSKKEETKTDAPPLVQDEPIHPAAASTTTPTVQATA